MGVVVKKAVAAMVAAAALSGGVVFAAPASAAPAQGDSWVDCSGPTLCTKYWSRAQTQKVDQDFQAAATSAGVVISALCGAAGGVGGGLVGGPAGAVAGAAVVGGGCYYATDQALGSDSADAARAAVLANGCLQLAWRKDQTGTPRWSYTTNSGYCWDS